MFGFKKKGSIGPFSRVEPYSRVETVKILLSLSYENAQQMYDVIKVLTPNVDYLKMVSDDTFQITYTLDLNYYGDVVKKLEAIEQLMDSGVPMVSNYTVINEARSLFIDIAQRLSRLVKR